MDRKSQLQPMVQLTLVDSALQSRVESLTRKANSEFSLCGARDNIKAPTKSLFWQQGKSLTFILTFESEQERNAAIVLARKYAFDCNVTLLGPDD
ncbi:unnamed protein product [Arabis nemorensis]|uniref:Stomatal closure-related actin-binding protein PH domain-containing protein n=1 Tax=Arabis nemorensis TaxID=586526 RepID=A0A565BWW3_9BRAS|nr:unnamed protein product [Arabis nemorensis]